MYVSDTSYLQSTIVIIKKVTKTQKLKFDG